MSKMADTGCQLPEELRRYYLEVMGIQLWQESRSETQHAEIESLAQEVPAAQAVVQSPDWDSLRVTVAACTQCALHQSRSQTVFGVGNQNADVLVIGEAPSQEEDARGEPFVGRAGELLNAMLQAIDLQREQVYIVNILKCRPPNDRDPLPQEVAHCDAYLQAQIELLQPKIIFAVGKIAAQSLLQSDVTVTELRGKWHDYRGIPLLVSYHPAYLLRKPTEKRKAWHDLLELKARLG